MDESDSAQIEVSARWTCEACGCRTNTEVGDPTSCGVCGTRRVNNIRRGLLASSIVFPSRENDDEDDNSDEEQSENDDHDSMERAVLRRRNDIMGIGERFALALGSSSVVPLGLSDRPISGSARRSSIPLRSDVNFEHLMNLAQSNAVQYKPKWSTVHCGRSLLVDKQKGLVACLTENGDSGRCVRAEEPIPCVYTDVTETADSEGRIFGWRIGFEHPTREKGRSMGGCYLLGVTTDAFNSFNARNGLQQSQLFWGIEDGGRRYEGGDAPAENIQERHGSANVSGMIQLTRAEAPRNAENVLFGSKEVVTVVADMNAGTLNFWRDGRFIGTLVSNLPKDTALYPVAVPFNTGVCVAITGMGDFSPPIAMIEYKRRQKELIEENNEARRIALKRRKDMLMHKGALSDEVKDVLATFWAWYQEDHYNFDVMNPQPISATAAARLWYRCGIKLSHLRDVMSLKSKSLDVLSNVVVEFEDFLAVIARILEEESEAASQVDEVLPHRSTSRSEYPLNARSTFEPGDKVELCDAFERFGDAYSGPLRPGDVGSVVEVQRGPREDRQSVRVLFNGRRWWYQPQALVSERSGLVEPPALRFLVNLLRAHGFSSDLSPLWGSPVTSDLWKVGDFVVPRKLKKRDRKKGEPLANVGVINECTNARRESGLVSVNFFSGLTKRIKAETLIYTTFFHGDQIDSIDWVGDDDVCLMECEEGDENAEVESRINEENLEVRAENILANADVKIKLDAITNLDRAGMLTLIRDCKKPKCLARLFSADLPGAIFSGIDCAISGKGDLAALSTFGTLCATLARQLLADSTPEEPAAEPEEAESSEFLPEPMDIDSRSNEDIPFDALSQRSASRFLSGRRISRRGQSLPSNAIDVRELVRDLGIGSDQRRGVLLALMASERMHLDPRALGRLASVGVEDGTDLNRNIFPFSRYSAEAALGLGAAEDEDDPFLSRARNASYNEENTVAGSTLLRARSQENRSLMQRRPVSPSTRSLVCNGLLLDCPAWCKRVIASGSDAKGHDEEGNSILFLALSFGCRVSVVEILVEAGCLISKRELQAAASSNQARSLEVLLNNTSYFDGMISTEGCSESILSVISTASHREVQREQHMKAAAANFCAQLFSRFVEITLKFCRGGDENKANICLDALIGKTLLHAVHQCQTRALNDTSLSNNSLAADDGRVPAFSASESNKMDMTSNLHPNMCLIEVITGEVFYQALSLTNARDSYYHLMEFYLWSKQIQNAVVGLTLARKLLNYPTLCQQVGRYGVKELCDAHRRNAQDQLAHIKLGLNAEAGHDDRVIKCPKRHTTILHLTRHSSFRCDLCGKGVEQGKPMHGCRECDWDACEKCTDLSEGGIVKWSYIKELASKCYDSWFADSTSESEDVRRIAEGITNRDPKAIYTLKAALSEIGSLTMYQFNSYVLPAIHAALSKESKNEFQVVTKETKKQVNTLKRHSKKPRVGGSAKDEFSYDLNISSRAIAAKRLYDPFSLALVSLLTQKPSNNHPVEEIKSELNDADHQDEDRSVDSSPSESKPDPISKNDTKLEVPPILRFLHTSLSFYEHLRVFKYHSSDVGGDLHSLLSPFDISIFPTKSYEELYMSSVRDGLNPPEVKNYLQESETYKLILRGEPLLSLQEVQRHIIRCTKIWDPEYIQYCKQLVSSIIIERITDSAGSLSLSNTPSKRWRIARVVAFDERTGSHTIVYAKDTSVMSILLSASNACEMISDELLFDGERIKFILALRTYYVLRRVHGSARQHRASVELDENRLKKDTILNFKARKKFNSTSKSCLLPGTRVDGDFRSFEGLTAYTVISSQMSPVRSSGIALSFGAQLIAGDTDNDRFAAGSDDTFSYTVVTDSGEVLENFPETSLKRNLDLRSASSSRSHKNCTGAVLKRRWSALGLTQKMSPLEFGRLDGAVCQKKESSPRSLSIEGSGVDNVVEIDLDLNSLESPPILVLELSLDKARKAFSFADPESVTLISALKQLILQSKESEKKLFTSRTCSLYYSFRLSWSDSNANSSTKGKISRSNLYESSFSGDDTELAPISGPKKCVGLNAKARQCLYIINRLAEYVSVWSDAVLVDDPAYAQQRKKSNNHALKLDSSTLFVSQAITKKLMDQLEDPLTVVGGALPDWCYVAPTSSPLVFSHESRRLLLERAAFGVSRSALRQQEAKIVVAPLRQRMAALRGRAVELVGEAFSGGASDPTALQLQADELYAMEEALASRVAAAFRAQRWDERSLECVKASVRRDHLLADASIVMEKYAMTPEANRRRLEIRFNGESGFDAASGEEAGVTRGFYADVAEALLDCSHVAGVVYSPCSPASITPDIDEVASNHTRLPLWIPDVDSSGRTVIPTPRAEKSSGIGVFPRPLSGNHPQRRDVLREFRFIGRLFAAALRDRFIFPLPLSVSFLKLVQSIARTEERIFMGHGKISSLLEKHLLARSEKLDLAQDASTAPSDLFLSSGDLPRPGFLGGEIYAVEDYICAALEYLEETELDLSEEEMFGRREEIAKDPSFARNALGKSYDCSFEDFFEGRTFVDPLDPSQDHFAVPLCPQGSMRPVTIHNVREWVTLAKKFFLHDGVIAQAEAFCRGVNDFFSADSLLILTPVELHKDVCGGGDNVDRWVEKDIRAILKLDGGKGAAEALVAVAAIGGEGGAALSRRFGPSSPTIGYLVKALFEANSTQRRQFLSFVTSVPIVTPGQIEVVPVVSPSGEFLPLRDPSCMPRANTCARRLYLPRFESYAQFKQVMYSVLNEESRFKGFYEWRG